MKIVLVRHGETLGNKIRMFERPLEGKLSRKGIAQARKAGESLKTMEFDIIYVSPSKRTKETAKYIVKHHKGTPIKYEKQIIERDPGVFAGTKYSTFSRLTQESTKQSYEFKPEKGESIKDLHERAETFMKKFLKKEKGKNALIISHGGFIRHFIMNILNRHPKLWRRYLHNNTGITIININDNGKPRLIKLNSTRHLE